MIVSKNDGGAIQAYWLSKYLSNPDKCTIEVTLIDKVDFWTYRARRGAAQ
jgi:hypothetical protein